MNLQRTESPTWLSNAYLLDDGAGTGLLIDGNGVAAPLLETVAQRKLDVPIVLSPTTTSTTSSSTATRRSAPRCSPTR